MKKTVTILSGLMSAILLGVTAVVGWYQAIQLKDFLSSDPRTYIHLCKTDISNQCSLWPDRFEMIAFGAVIPFVLSPFVLVLLDNIATSLSAKRRVIIWVVVTTLTVLVYLSGVIIYALLG